MKKLIVGSLVFVLLGGVFMFAQQKPRKMNNEHSRMMMEQLNLTDAQKEKVQALRLDHQKQMIDLKAELQKKELSLKELEASKSFSRSDYLSAVKDISSAKNKIAEAMANHRMDVYEMLDDNQKEIWSKMDHRFGPDRMGMRERDGKRMQRMHDDKD